MRTLVLAAALSIGACHHDAPAPAEPADKPPLPPASGTPIGFLLDDASELHLRDDQVAKLHDIDASLSAELEKLDAATRAANRPSDADATPASAPSGGRGGRHRGGMGGGGMGGGGMGGGGASGGMGGGGRSGGHHHKGGGAGSASPSGGAAAANRLADERTADVKLALQRALE